MYISMAESSDARYKEQQAQFAGYRAATAKALADVPEDTGIQPGTITETQVLDASDLQRANASIEGASVQSAVVQTTGTGRPVARRSRVRAQAVSRRSLIGRTAITKSRAKHRYIQMISTAILTGMDLKTSGSVTLLEAKTSLTDPKTADVSVVYHAIYEASGTEQGVANIVFTDLGYIGTREELGSALRQVQDFLTEIQPRIVEITHRLLNVAGVKISFSWTNLDVQLGELTLTGLLYTAGFDPNTGKWTNTFRLEFDRSFLLDVKDAQGFVHAMGQLFEAMSAFRDMVLATMDGILENDLVIVAAFDVSDLNIMIGDLKLDWFEMKMSWDSTARTWTTTIEVKFDMTKELEGLGGTNGIDSEQMKNVIGKVLVSLNLLAEQFLKQAGEPGKFGEILTQMLKENFSVVFNLDLSVRTRRGGRSGHRCGGSFVRDESEEREVRSFHQDESEFGRGDPSSYVGGGSRVPHGGFFPCF